MANYIRLTAPLGDSDASYRDFRDAVSALTDDDVSKTSPVSGGGREVGILVGSEEVVLAVDGHDGDFTKTSETALVGVLKDVLGDDVEIEIEGGYTDDDEPADDTTSDDDSTDDSTGTSAFSTGDSTSDSTSGS